MLAISNIQSFYGESQALFGVSLKVTHGEAIALLGVNGAGKTTILRSILGLTPPRSGEISFEGKTITDVPTHEISKLGIGWVPEERRVFPSLKVRTNLSLGLKKSNFRSWSLGECFSLFSALEYLMDRECENLSGGEMQMVAITRALLGGPGLMLMDEPSQGLAPKLVQDVMKSVRRMKDEGVAIILVEQHAGRALEVTDRVYVIDKGRIIHEGQSQALLDDEPLRKNLLGG